MKKLLMVNAGITALLGSSIAQAGYSPFYAGAGVGNVKTDGTDKQFCDLCQGSQFSMRNHNNNGYKLYGGVNLSDQVAIEGEVVDFGKTYDLDMYRPTLDGRAERAHATTKARGVGVSAKVRKHLRNGRTSIYGKGGALAWETKNHMDYTNMDNISETYKSRNRGVSPTLGIGVEHEFNARWSMRVGWDHYFKVGRSDRYLHVDENRNVDDLRSVKTDVDMVYVGATFNF